MTSVYLHMRMQPGAHPGIAVGTIWPAFSSKQFQVHKFTLPFGEGNQPVRQQLSAGSYWIQLKLPTGEIVKEIVSVPEGPEDTTVFLNGPHTRDDFNNPRGQTYVGSRLPKLLSSGDTESAEQTRPARRTPTPRGTSTGRGLGLIVGNKATPTTVGNRISTLTERPRYFSFPEIGANRFSLSLLRKKMMEWPSRASGRKDSLAPEFYFNGILRSRDRTSMVAELDGNFVSSYIREISQGDYLRRENSARTVVREFALLEDSRRSHRLLIGVPRLRGGKVAKLIVRSDEQDSKRLVKLSIEVDDPKFNSMLQFMKGSDIGSAIRLAESSLPILYAKFDNPLAAAAAGYVLVQAPPETIRVPWGQWIGNLGHYFPDLPDGKILHATLLLQRGDTVSPNDFYEDHSQYFPLDRHERNVLAASLVIDSLAKGPPVFRAGIALLATNIRILSSVDLPEKTRALLQAADTLVTSLGMKVDPREPFSIFRLD
jgi:hypothetical protein